MAQASRGSKNVIYKTTKKNAKTVQPGTKTQAKKAAPKKAVAKKVAKAAPKKRA